MSEIDVTRGKGADDLLDSSVESSSTRVRMFTAYAPPIIWGPDVTIASHIGEVTFTITYSAVGDTLVFGKVKYYKKGGSGLVEEEFRGETTITTSNSVANIIVEFKGVPLGSAVEGTVTP